SKQLHVSELAAARLTVTFASTGQTTGLPGSLALPLPVVIDRVAIAALEVHAGSSSAQVSAVELAYAGDQSGHHLRGPRVESELGAIRADANLKAGQPFELDGTLGFARRDPRAPIEASATLAGDLANPALRFQATMGATRVDGTATLRPFETSWLAALSL